MAFTAGGTVGALGSQVRRRLLAASPGDREALKRLGAYGFVKGRRRGPARRPPSRAPRGRRRQSEARPSAVSKRPVESSL